MEPRLRLVLALFVATLLENCLFGSYFLYKIATDEPALRYFLLVGANAFTIIISAVAISSCIDPWTRKEA